MRKIVITGNRGLQSQAQAGISLAGATDPIGIYGMYARVKERHSEDHSVDVETGRGYLAKNVPVASRGWVWEDDNGVGGVRDLPPVGAYVYVVLPDGQIENGFVLCSFFPGKASDAIKKEFFAEGKESEVLSEIEGKWKRTYDKEKGDLQVEDNDSFVLIVKKSEKKIDLTDWNGNKLLIDENGAKVTDKNSNEITMDGSGVLVKDKNGNKVELAAGGATITTAQGKITGGTLEVNGSATPTGTGPFCALPFCPITGAPHVGSKVAGT